MRSRRSWGSSGCCSELATRRRPRRIRWVTVPRVRGLIIVALLGSALALGACGGGDGKGAGEGRSLPAAEYRAQLARLCVDSSRDAARIGGVQGANGSALAAFFDELAAVAARHEQQFESLRPPPGLRNEQSQLTRLLAEGVATIRQAAADFRSSDDLTGTYKEFATSYNRSLRQRNEVVKRLDVPKCQETELGSSAGSVQGSS